MGITVIGGTASLLAAPNKPVSARPTAKPAPSPQTLPQAQPAPLECLGLTFSGGEFTLPALDAAAALMVRNVSAAAAVIVKPGLGFAVSTGSGAARDITKAVYVDPDEANPWIIAPGQTAQLKFKVQFLNDTPPGGITVSPRVEYFSQADNALPLLQTGTMPAKASKDDDAARWTVDNPTAGFNASAASVLDESLPLGGESAVRLDVKDNKLRGRITLQSPKGGLRSSTDYVAGVFNKSDRSGWDSPINKGASVVEYNADGAVRAHEIHVFEIPSWNWHLTRFKSDARAGSATMAVWNRGWATGQTGQSWYGAAFIVPKAKLLVLKTAQAALASVTIRPAQAGNIVFLGDDRPKSNEGGNWIGRYGGESFILAAMQAPQDIVGGRLLPKRRWAAGNDGFAPTSVAWTENKGDFFYEVLTGDPKEPARHWIPSKELVSEQQRALINPLEGGRRYSSWDDRGELHPFDNKGPDLIVNMEIPAGLHRLSLYFIDWDFHEGDRPRSHRLFISDGSKDENALLSSGYVSDLGQGMYKVYGVAGPCKLRLRVQKDRSVCSVLSGVFLDDIVLPDIVTNFPVTKPTVGMQQVISDYRELRNLSQNSPETFLGSAPAMRKLLREATALSQDGSQSTKALGHWLRWQATTSLLVAPWVREEAFRSYLAARPPRSASQARLMLRSLIAQGQLAEGKIVTPLWLRLSRDEALASRKWVSAATQRLASGGENLYLSEIRPIMELFVERDADFAAQQMALWVINLKARGEGPKAALVAADELAKQVRKANAGELKAAIGYRAVAAFYDAVEQVYGWAALGEAGSLKRALAIGATPGYDMTTSRKALAAYEKHLARWPEGRYSQQALMAVVDYGCALGAPSQSQARVYSARSAQAARILLDRADAKAAALKLAVGGQAAVAERSGVRPIGTALVSSAKDKNSLVASDAGDEKEMLQSPQLRMTANAAALSAAWAMASYYSGIGDNATAHQWYGEIVQRTSDSELGKQAAALMKKAEA